MLNSYWKYAGTRYRHKFKAIEASNGSVHDITFHAFENFPNYDWTTEPAESLRYLMKERALQLRDTYSYLKFWFSGGADSTTVLNVFLENNIYIDEIGVYNYSFGDDTLDESNYETNNFTLPYLKSIQHLIPKTKIKKYVYDKQYYDKYLGDKWLQTRSSFSPRHFYFPNIKGKNYCNIICGLDPRVLLENNKWYMQLFDTSGLGECAGFRNIELFYTTDDMVSLHAKQCHMIKNHYESNNVGETPSYALFKDIVRTAVRDPSIVQEPNNFRKDTKDKWDRWIFQPKDRFFLSNAHVYDIDKVKSIAYAKVSNRPLHRLFLGYEAHKIYMGDANV